MSNQFATTTLNCLGSVVATTVACVTGLLAGKFFGEKLYEKGEFTTAQDLSINDLELFTKQGTEDSQTKFGYLTWVVTTNSDIIKVCGVYDKDGKEPLYIDYSGKPCEQHTSHDY